MSNEAEMTQRNFPGCTPFGVFCQRSLFRQGLCWISGLGILSSGMVWAQTDPNPDNIGGSSAAQEAPPVVRFETAPTARPSAPETVTRPAKRQSASPSVRRRRSAPTPERTAVRRRRSVPTPERTVVRRRTVPAFEPTVVRQRPVSEPAPAVVRQRAPEPDTATLPKRTLSAPQLSVPNPNPEVIPSGVVPSPAEEAQVAQDFNNRHIDPTEYRIGATPYEAPDAVVLSERATGCQTTLQNGQGLSGGECGTARRIPARNSYPTARNSYPTPRKTFNAGSIDQTAHLPAPRKISSTRPPRPFTLPGLVTRRQTGLAETQSVQIGSIRVSRGGVRARNRQTRRSSSAVAYLPSRNSNGTQQARSPKPTALDYFNRAVRPPKELGNGNTSLIFPLSIPAPITSLFGWRIHPISGDRRFHSGTDLGAPLGTPVLAAYAGQVAVADWMGGYGLAVVLHHNEGSEETRYAHLSEVFVQPGEWVEQGTVIGRVGSTGNSTGPHLHFEFRQLMPDGWVALDPGSQLEYALGQLLKSLQTARSAEPAPESAE